MRAAGASSRLPVIAACPLFAVPCGFFVGIPVLHNGLRLRKILAKDPNLEMKTWGAAF
jgi:hypothetical protein